MWALHGSGSTTYPRDPGAEDPARNTPKPEDGDQERAVFPELHIRKYGHLPADQRSRRVAKSPRDAAVRWSGHMRETRWDRHYKATGAARGATTRPLLGMVLVTRGGLLLLESCHCSVTYAPKFWVYDSFTTAPTKHRSRNLRTKILLKSDCTIIRRTCGINCSRNTRPSSRVPRERSFRCMGSVASMFSNPATGPKSNEKNVLIR